MRRFATVLVVCSVALGMLQFSASRARGQGEVATWSVGDFWEYSGSGSIMGNPFSVIMKVEPKDKVSVTVGSISYETWHCSASMSMTVGGMGVSYALDLYIRVSDLADVKMTASFGGSTMTMTYDPPNTDFDFPLSNGKTWSRTSLETTTTSPGGTSSRTVTVNYEASGPESVTVPAGKFSAYKIERTEQGLPGNTTTTYYSDTVGYAVKMGSPLEGLSANLELKSYKYQAKEFLGGMLWLLILVIIIVIAVAVIVGLMFRRRRARMMAPPPTQYQPVYGQPPQQTPHQIPAQPPRPPQQPPQYP